MLGHLCIALLRAIFLEAVVLQQADKSHLIYASREDGDVNLINCVMQSIIKDYLEKSLPNPVTVQANLETPNLESFLGLEERFNIVVLLFNAFNLHVKEGDNFVV